VNIALGALILALLLFPAIAFRFAINKSAQLKELVGTLSITDSFWAFLFVPLLIHGSAMSFIQLFMYKRIGEIRFDILYQVVIGNKDLVVHNREFYNYVAQFLNYTWICILLGYLLGYGFAWLEDRGRRLEYSFIEKFTLSRLLGLDNNNWYALLDERPGMRKGRKARSEKIDLVYVNILAYTRETTTIYSGLLYDYYFKHRSKELGHLVLQHAVRRDLRKEQTASYREDGLQTINTYSNSMGASRKVPGEYFIIPAEQIRNLNITYFEITE